MGNGSLQGVKRQGPTADQPPHLSAEVLNRVELTFTHSKGFSSMYRNNLYLYIHTEQKKTVIRIFNTPIYWRNRNRLLKLLKKEI